MLSPRKRKQRQKQRKKGALEEVTDSQFDVLRLPDGSVARCSLQGMIAANFEDDAVPSTPAARACCAAKAWPLLCNHAATAWTDTLERSVASSPRRAGDADRRGL